MAGRSRAGPGRPRALVRPGATADSAPPPPRTWRTRCVAVAVSAMMGTPGSASRMPASWRNAGRKSWPYSEMQCASSTATIAMPWGGGAEGEAQHAGGEASGAAQRTQGRAARSGAWRALRAACAPMHLGRVQPAQRVVAVGHQLGGYVQQAVVTRPGACLDLAAVKIAVGGGWVSRRCGAAQPWGPRQLAAPGGGPRNAAPPLTDGQRARRRGAHKLHTAARAPAAQRPPPTSALVWLLPR